MKYALIIFALLASLAWADDTHKKVPGIFIMHYGVWDMSDDAIIQGEDIADKTIVFSDYDRLIDTRLTSVHLVMRTSQYLQIMRNDLEKGCWFTIDGKDYKTPQQIIKALDILENISRNSDSHIFFKANRTLAITDNSSKKKNDFINSQHSETP